MEELVVGTLLDAYDQFNRFKLLGYYTVSFGGFPSALRTVLQLERSKENIETVLQSIDFDRFAFELIFKNWTTNDFQDTKEPGDYAFEYVYKSKMEHMLIQITFLPSMLHIHFLYDVNSPETEEWVLEINRHLRATHVSPKIPKFKVLIHQEGMFGTEDVNTGDFNSVDVKEMYNDDFAEIDEIITNSLTKKESGIILLHGDPGTGKTTYIKHLICKFKDKEFIFVQNDFVRDLLKPSFISFLLQNKNAILIIEDAEKVVASRNNASEDSVVSTILQLTDGLFSDFLNIKIICTFNTDIERIDKALLRKGRMIAKYNFKPLSPEKTAALIKKLGYEELKGSLTLADIFGYEKRDFKDTTKTAIGFGVKK
jgi:hypothetical protein